MTSKYSLGPSGSPCSDHPCDLCPDCLAGRCCGEAVVEADLPVEGTWPAATHVAVGHVVETSAGLMCHVCGESFHALYAHIGTHNLNAESYRSTFGLAVGRPLASVTLRAQRRRDAALHGAPGSYEPLRAFQEGLTGEQRSLISWRRVQRAEVRARLVNQAPAANRASVIARQDPAVHKAWTVKLRARRPRAADRSQGQQCPECSRWFCPINSQRKLCGDPVCLSRARSRAGQLGRKRQLQGVG